MFQDQAKLAIQKLVEKYEAIKALGKDKSYSEEQTKKDFILPLFEALGWSVYESSSVTAEEQISGERVDYGFYANGRIKFYLEAKKFAVDIHREEYAKQAIKYSWNKGITWAVLTDFETLIVFNALSPEKALHGKKYFEIPYSQYIVRFDQLWLLSKEAFEKDLMDAEAEKVGKKLQKLSVTNSLYKDLNECREILTEAFLQWNPKADPHLIDEGVQKLLNRLVFIRAAEDRAVEPHTLIPLIHEWVSGGRKGSPYQAMVKKFRELDKVYNSNLFDEHPFESWEEYSGATEKVIDILYGKQSYFEYDFSAIPADVLGAVYENYLGYKLEKSKKDLFGQGLELSKDSKKRKEQGIYYTPKFIVDYIVQNALGPVLDKCKSINDLQKIKVLDPACGSGSFLVAAFNFMVKKYEDFGNKPDAWVKIQILQNNIYGVDLDQQAVELARLNLLLQTFDSQIKLPNLGNNIKSGNSLISGTDEELKKYFGKDYKDKNPFNWQEQFPDVFKQGGFDCIIGNPPYLDSEEMTKSQGDFREYAVKFYKSAKGNWDLFCIFIDQGLNLLKKEGLLSLIVPNKLLSAKYAEATRKIMEDNKIILLRDYSNVPVFNASVYPIVLVVEKQSSINNKVKVVSSTTDPVDLLPPAKLVSQKTFSDYKEGWAPVFTSNENNLKFINKIIKGTKLIGDHYAVRGAATVGEAYEIKKIVKEHQREKDFLKLINTGTIDRYYSAWGEEPTRYIKDLYQEPIVEATELKKIYPKRYQDSVSEKIIIAGMTKEIEAFLDLKGEYLAGKSTTIITGTKDELKFLLALLNSKLMTFVYSYVFKSLAMQGGYLRFGSPQIKQLPLPTINKPSKQILNLVGTILELNRELNNVSQNSNEWEKLKDEIAKTDQKINQEVYKLYGLTDEEIKIIEGKV